MNSLKEVQLLIMLRRNAFFAMGIFIAAVLPGRSSCQTFQTAIGSAAYEILNDVKPTHDGKYFMTGSTPGAQDINSSSLFVMKLDAFGDTLWSRVIGGNSYDSGYSVLPLEDHGVVIVGQTGSFGAGYSDGLFLRLDQQGDLVSSRTYGGIWADKIISILMDPDGFILMGTTSRGNGREILLMTIDHMGDVLWSKTFITSVTPDPVKMIRLANNDLLIGGFMGDVTMGFLMRLTPTGEVIWSNRFSSVLDSQVRGFMERADGSLLITGVARNFSLNNSGDMYLMKIDQTGAIEWTRLYGGNGTEIGKQVMEMPDGDLMAFGLTSSFGNGQLDLYLVRTDSIGSLIWSKAYGGSLEEYGEVMDTISNGGFLLWGTTHSHGGGDRDFYLIRTDSSGFSGCNEMDVPTQMTEVTFSRSPLVLTSMDVVLTVTVPDLFMGRGIALHDICRVDVGLGEQLSRNSCLIYPNPSSGDLYVEVGSAGDHSVHIHNSNGQLVHSAMVRQEINSIDMKGKPAGLYLVTVNTGSWRSTQRLMLLAGE